MSPSIFLLPYADGMNGCRRAPHAILSHRNGRGHFHSKIAELPIYLNDAEKTAESTERLLNGQDNFVVLGGDHASSAGVVRALNKSYGETALVLFDAHHDQYTKDDGTLGRFDCGNWIAYSREYISSVTHICSSQQEKKENVPLPRNKRLHISVDLDVLDAREYGWSANYCEVGGLKLEQLLDKLQWVRNQTHMPITADLVEYNPTLDSNGAGAWCCSLILDKLLEIVGQP